MYNFNKERYLKVIDDALALLPKVEKVADEITKDGFSNIFFIGCGGTYSHTLPLKYFLDSKTTIESHCVIAAEFMVMGHKRFSKDSICVFSTRTGNTKEIVQAAEFCKKAGARVFMYVCHKDSPACEFATYLVDSFAEDDHLGEAIYLVNIPFMLRLAHNQGQFKDYDKFIAGLKDIGGYLVEAKELYEDRCKAIAEKNKNTEYHMVVGTGYLWGEAYDYAMCILEEMQWIKTKSIHGAEFFHGTLEVVEKDTSVILFFGDDETRPLMDRVKAFVDNITTNVSIFDTAEPKLPFETGLRKIVSPMVVYALTERLSCHLERVRNHSLKLRRYYRQFDY